MGGGGGQTYHCPPIIKVGGGTFPPCPPPPPPVPTPVYYMLEDFQSAYVKAPWLNVRSLHALSHYHLNQILLTPLGGSEINLCT